MPCTRNHNSRATILTAAGPIHPWPAPPR